MPESHAHRSNPRDIGVRAVRSASASIRLQEARRFLKAFSPGTELLLIGASRGAVDDLARTIALERRAIFGLHRLSFTQLAARLAASDLADRGHAPVSALGDEALAARAAFEAANDKALEYFLPVSDTPGFPKALARTLLELRLGGVAVGSMAGLLRSGPDLSDLLERIEKLMSEIGVSDRASLFETATMALSPKDAGWRPMPLLLLDVPFESHTEARFLLTLIEKSPQVLITVPEGDARTVAYLEKSGVKFQTLERKDDTDLARLSRNLFSAEPPPEHERTGELVWLSAPGEARECVEIARRILKEGANGVQFDEIAILIRSPQQYVGVLEHALARAKIPAFFDRGIRRPHPAGRAFLAILNCATENLSAKRFAEYLSLAQVPSLVEGVEKEPTESWVASRDEVFGVLSELARDGPEEKAAEDPSQTDPNPAAAVIAGTLRTPWKWENLLVESAVIGGNDRWARRLDGLREQYLLKISELTDNDPGSSRITHLQHELQNLEHLRAFALPLIETMSAWPDQARWENWLQYLEGFAKRVLKNPDQVSRVLADLRPMGTVGPVSITEVRNVLRDRLLSLEVEPPSDRYGRVFVGSPDQVRGRGFRVVFLPCLAERLFPQKLREDPLLLDGLRQELGTDLPVQADRAESERLLLRLAVGSATEKVYASFPRIEISESRARVPSLYALEIMRAVTGRILDHQALERMAAQESQASLAWPAPTDAINAIDDFEHDLSVLRALMTSQDEVKGRAHYMLTLNDCLRRSVTERWARAKNTWSQYDGLVRITDLTLPFLQTQRLGARPYSVSALQQYAACPYRFLLSTIYHLAPQEEPESLQRVDPLTRGRLFHQVQAEFFRGIQQAKLSIATSERLRVLEILDNTLTRIGAEYYEALAPAIDRVWQDEISRIRTDLRVWVNGIASSNEWEPWLSEFAIGLPGQSGHDPSSQEQPVTIDGRFILRGSVDLVERKPGTKILRVTDHKTSKNRSRRGAIIGGGAQLQPVIYSLAVEQATGFTVETGRFSYCTTAGGFTDHCVPINARTRQMGIEVFEIVDRAIEIGMLPPAPAEKACAICDFLPVCGPDQERRASGKSNQQIEDLLNLRKRP